MSKCAVIYGCSGLKIFLEGGDEAGEHGVRAVGARLELGMILAGHEEGVIDAFYHFHEAVIWVHAAGAYPPALVL